MVLFAPLTRLVLTRFRWFFAFGDDRDAEILALRHQILASGDLYLDPTRLAARTLRGRIVTRGQPSDRNVTAISLVRLGLTATPYRRDKLEALIAFQCGPTRHEIAPAAVDPTELVRRELIVHHTTTEVADDETAHIQDLFRLIADDHPRTAQICQDVHAACASGRTCLVLTQRTEHIDAIVERLYHLGDTALVLSGGLGKRARQAVADALAAREPSSGVVLVATGSYLGEGFDWPELDTLFLTFPLAFMGRVVQYVGRLLRTMKANAASSCTTTSTGGSLSSTACTPNASPSTPPSASTSPYQPTDAEHHRGHRCLLTMSSPTSTN